MVDCERHRRECIYILCPRYSSCLMLMQMIMACYLTITDSASIQFLLTACFQLFFGLAIIISLVVTNATAGFVRRSQDIHAHQAPLHPSGSYMHPAPRQTPTVVHYTATPGIGYGGEGYGQQHQLGWSTSTNSMWNGEQQSIEYQGNPTKRHRARSRSPEKLRHGAR
jgi:hypothetical protein